MSVVRRHRGWRLKALSCGVLLAAVALGLPAQAAFAAPAPDTTSAPSKESLESLLERLQTLYQDTEKATEAYDGAKEKLDKERKTLDDLSGKLDKQRDAVRSNRERIGQLARSQYIDGNLSDYSKFLASKDPQTAFDQGHILSSAANTQAVLAKRLRSQEKKLDSMVHDQRGVTDRVGKLAKKQKDAKREVDDKLKSVEDIVTSLTGAQRDELKKLEKEGLDASQAAFLGTGALGKDTRGASAAGLRAVEYAFDHLGDPYVWGAEGPTTFDCSGLTSQAWAHAGHPIPRTSQEQWKQLPKVPLNELRPGDLVIYFPGATHVAMYIGNGLIVQAPHTGDVVKVSPVGGMPVLGAVRPDPDAKSVGSKPPKVPPTPKPKSLPKAKSSSGDKDGDKGGEKGTKKPAPPQQTKAPGKSTTGTGGGKSGTEPKAGGAPGTDPKSGGKTAAGTTAG